MPDYKKANQPDAVCFTSGPKGVPFGLGVIHAYLVADREPPKIVAGVSGGALNAAAMQRCYRDLEAVHEPEFTEEQRESERWRWFRRYLDVLVDDPFSVFWKAIPDTSDIIATRPPIRETALPTTISGTEGEDWKKAEWEHRVGYQLLIQVGRWLTHLPITVRNLTQLAGAWVRATEDYPDVSRFFKLTRWPLFVLHAFGTAVSLLWTTAIHPGLVRLPTNPETGSRSYRPLFGWPLWLAICTVWPASVCVGVLAQTLWSCLSHLFPGRHLTLGIGLSLALTGALVWLFRRRVKIFWTVCTTIVPFVTAGVLMASLVAGPRGLPWWLVLCSLLPPGILGGACAAIFSHLKSFSGQSCLGYVMEQVELHHSLLNDFYLRLKLFHLFQENGVAPLVQDTPMPALLAASPLQGIENANPESAPPIQLWAKAHCKTTVVDALCACLAKPPMLKPFEPKTPGDWVNSSKPVPPGLQLVDAALVCPNPLPALFDELKQAYRAKTFDAKYGRLLATVDEPYKVHLVHGLPVKEKRLPEAADLSQNGDMPRLTNTVDAAILGMRLSKRRDSLLESWQTNYQTDLAIALGNVCGEAPQDLAANDKKVTLPILVDEIAPAEELKVDNVVGPKESELLRHAAAGCRRMLAAIYRKELSLAGGAAVCPEFLKGKTRERALWQSKVGGTTVPGVAEVCRHCTQLLELSRHDAEHDARPSLTMKKAVLQGGFRENPVAAIPCEFATRQRIVFLASGGVFRGAFHIGMIAAMHALRIKPDMIVGASVGTLMGAVLASVSQLPQREADELLAELVDTFVYVDSKVALTKRLKSAARDLAERGRTIDASFQSLYEEFWQGSKNNAGFAATGAPPSLIDAFSRLFLIPYNLTTEMAAQFASENVVGAVGRFLELFRAETVVRLGINDAVIGNELLYLQMQKLLKHVNSAEAQPFLLPGKHPPIAFFATTVNLSTEWMHILGSEVNRQKQSYDFLQAALSSSAFPFAFAPRRDSEVYPGKGRRDIFYGDGGMYDNLPFLPAVLLLGQLQHFVLKDSHPEEKWSSLVARCENPDLFLVGGLDVSGGKTAPRSYRTVPEIYAKAQSLAKNEKTRRFAHMAARMDRTLGTYIRKNKKREQLAGRSLDWEILNNYVHAGVLAVEPSTSEHLNGTFAFSKSLGLKREKVRRSIADGCFQMMLEISQIDISKDLPDSRALATLQANGRMPVIRAALPGAHGPEQCPYFSSDGKSFNCPFHSVRKHEIFNICQNDPAHQKLSGERFGSDRGR